MLKQYKTHSVPVKLKTPPWSRQRLQSVLDRGPHQSCFEHINFLREEFVDMINKDQWIVLPFSVAKLLPNLRLSPPGVIPQRERRPLWIVDYSYYNLNKETIPIAPMDAMQFGHTLDRILHELLLADLSLGPNYLLKLDISDGYYRVNLNISNIPKLGVVFPTLPGEEPLVAFPLVLPMGWTNSPPCFCAATETATDLANDSLSNHQPSSPHHLDDLAVTMDVPDHSNTALLTDTTLTDQLHQQPSRDPSLPTSTNPNAYVDVFVDDFLTLCQGSKKNVDMSAAHSSTPSTKFSAHVMSKTHYFDAIQSP